jgi:hypothetical protein
MWATLRFYWIAARGYRLQPWKSPYLQWRFETFLGKEAASLDAKKFFELSWKYRDRLKSFAQWAAERRHARQRDS